ncbi:MAG: hypothetical protein ACKPKO_41680, partial [Candidatus Fonsibacter sp.]
FVFWGSGKHLRHDNSSNVVPTAACSTHVDKHAGTCTRTTSIKLHANCCPSFCLQNPLTPGSLVIRSIIGITKIGP